MQAKRTSRRPHGTGALIETDGAYYGKWRVGGRQIKRKLGPVRTPSARDGLTRTQAEAKLRTLMGEATAPPAERLTIAEVAERLLVHLEVMGRKPSTLRSYRALLRSQIGPHLGHRPIAQLTREHVERFAADMLGTGLAPKTIANALGFLSLIVEHAVKRGWAPSNPCRDVEPPASTPAGHGAAIPRHDRGRGATACRTRRRLRARASGGLPGRSDERAAPG